MKIPTRPRNPRTRRAIVIGALSVLTLGGFRAAFATSAGAATPAPVSTTSTVSPAAPAAPVTAAAPAKDTDTLQQGDQTGPDTTNDGETATK